MELKKYKLGEIFSIKQGYAFKSEKYLLKSPYRLCTLGNIDEGNCFKFNDAKANYYSDDFPKDFVLHEGDLIIPLTEQTMGLFGNTAFIPKTEDYNFVLNQRVGKILYNETLVNKYYLHYLLATNNVRKQIEATATGTTQRNTSPDKISIVEVLIPNIDIQNKIGNFLYDIESKISLNSRINAKLEAMAKRLYDYWFVQFDFPNADDKPYKSTGGKMEYNDILKRQIPSDWEVKRLGTLFTSNRGVSYSTKTITGSKGIPMINLASFSPDGSYNIKGIKLYTGDYPADKVLKPYDLVMCNTQQTAIDFSKDIIGKAFLVPDIFDGDITSSHHVNTLKLSDNNLKFYLYRLFNTDYFHTYISHYASGTNIMGLDFAGVENYMCEIPPVDVLKKFSDLMLNIEKKKSEIIRENTKLISLRDRLLPLLMNGQVEVK